LSAIKEVTVKKPMRRWGGLLIVAAVLTAAALLLGACGSSSSSGGSSPSAQETPKPGGTYIYPIGADPLSIEPLNLQEADAAQITHEVFQGLYMLQQQPDGTTKAVPDLAEKTVMSPDAKTFTFTIKKGVTFGPPVNREVTAQDFIDSWNYVLDPANKSVLSSYLFQNLAGLDPKTGYAYPNKPLSSLKLIDKYTFQVTLKQAFSQFPVTLVNDVAKVFPTDYAKQVGLKAFADKPIGTGPYMVQSWQHNKQITLVKNPNYWNKTTSGNSATAGYVDEIDYPIYHDVSTEYLAFQKGSVDFSAVPPGSWIAAQNLPNVKNGQWTAKAYPNTGIYFYGVSMNKPMLGGAANQPIRAALNMAADRQTVSQIVNQGVSIPSDEIVPVTIPGYVPGLNPYATNFQGAQAELDKFKGTLPTNIPLWYNSGAGHDKIAQAVVAGWNKYLPSLSFKLNGIETNAYWTALNENKPPALFRMGWVADYPSIDNFIYLFTTKGGSYGSYTWYSNKQVDQLFDQARAATDQQQAYDLYNEAQKLILQDAPAIPLYTYRDARLTNNRIGGFNYNAFALTDMWKLWVK
jgi:peptide/nickel transport system substrate-binding protein/oligopeptide transport system substrate-binding protein